MLLRVSELDLLEECLGRVALGALLRVRTYILKSDLTEYQLIHLDICHNLGVVQGGGAATTGLVNSLFHINCMAWFILLYYL